MTLDENVICDLMILGAYTPDPIKATAKNAPETNSEDDMVFGLTMLEIHLAVGASPIYGGRVG